MKKPEPVEMWAIFAASLRTEWVIPHTVRRTRKEAIDAYLASYDPGSAAAHWSFHTDRVKAYRVVVEKAPEKIKGFWEVKARPVELGKDW